MKRKTKFIAFIGTIMTFILLISSAFSLWFFGDVDHGNTVVEQNLRTDDIKENYTFGKPTFDEFYEIYIYPSALYYDVFESLSGDAKLEDQFGYKELLTDKNGAIILDDNGNPQFNLVAKDGYSSGTSGDYGYTKYIEDHDMDNDPNYFLKKDGGRREIYDYVTNGSKTKYGVPNEEFNARWYTGNKPGEDDNFRFTRNPHLWDRFGAFDEFYYGSEGRYLPIRLDVTNALNINTFLRSIPTPITSMGAVSNWFDFRHASWYPLLKTNNEYHTAVDAFRCKDANRYFDMLNDLEEYVSDSYTDSGTGKVINIIRLLPSFHDGKNQVGGHYSGVSDGQRDGIKLLLENDDGSKKKYFATYITDSLDNTNAINDYNASNIMYATLPPLYLDSNVKNIDFTSAIVANTTTSYPALGNNIWDYRWHRFTNLNKDVLTRLVTQYGSGLYRPYVFIGNSGVGTWHYKFNSSTNPTSINQYSDVPQFNLLNTYPSLNTSSTTFSEYATSSSGFSNLRNKSLIQIDETTPCFSDLTFKGGTTTSTIDDPVNRHFIWGTYQENSTDLLLRPVEVALEKIDAITLVEEIDNNMTYDEYLATIPNRIAESRKMVRQRVNTVYNKDLLVNATSTVNSLNPDNDKVYLIRNVDFRKFNSNKLNVQFRFTAKYDNNPDYNTSPTIENVVLKPHFENGAYKYDKNSVFESCDRYFDATNILFSNNSGSEVIGVLKNEYYETDDASTPRTLFPGVFDFLIIKDLTASKIDYPNGLYNIYCYRHMNIFVKLFADDLSLRNDDSTINHLTPLASNQLVWEKQYAIGDNMTVNDLNNDRNKSLINAINEIYLAKKANDSSINGLKIFDHVSRRRVGYYDGTTLNIDMNITKNHILYTSTTRV